MLKLVYTVSLSMLALQNFDPGHVPNIDMTIYLEIQMRLWVHVLNFLPQTIY